MRRRSMASLGLLLLTAAAAPPGPCGPAEKPAPIGQTESTGAPHEPGLPAISEIDDPCDSGGVEPPATLTITPNNEAEEALHGLPPSEALRPIDHTREVPAYR